MFDDISWSEVKDEMRKDGFDLLEQVLALIMGGVLGGKALELTRSTGSPLGEMIAYFILIVIGFSVLGIIHFVVSFNRVLSEKEDS